MSKLFPTYEIGSLPKINARVRASRGQFVTDEDINEVRTLAQRYSVGANKIIDILESQRMEKRKLTQEEESDLIDFNALLYIRLQEGSGVDFVYDGEARRAEMYTHVASKIEGFERMPEMIRSRGPDSWRMARCVAPPQLKENSLDSLIVKEFEFANKQAVRPVKIPVDDPYMIAVMSDNRYYLEALRMQYGDNPHKLRYEAKRAFTLALARNIIHPQVEAVAQRGATWVQLDMPAATLDVEHIPIMVEGINAVVEGVENIKFSLHICYPRRVSLTEKKGYDLLFPAILDLNQKVDHISLELANADQYEKDLDIFARYSDQRKFELGVGVIDITQERQNRGIIETAETVRERILLAAKTLGDPKLVYVAPDCGLRQLKLDRCLRIYETLVKGAEMARKG